MFRSRVEKDRESLSDRHGHRRLPLVDKHPDKIRVGDFLDVEVLFTSRSNSERLFRYSNDTRAEISSLRGKSLVICCVSLPSKDELIIYLHGMKAAYSELLERAEGNYEMVTVVKMREEDEAAFNKFFTNFPGLTIPFDEAESRSFVCDSLGLGSQPMVGLILSKEHKVLQNDYCGSSFSRYGAAFFPFTNARVNSLATLMAAFNKRFEMGCFNNTIVSSLDLSHVLNCDPSKKLKRVRGNSDEIITVGEMSKKNCVGVYICTNGDFVPNLDKIYQECKANSLEFEIVVVRVPLLNHEPSPADTEEFEISSMEYKSSSSWWILECNGARRCRLHRFINDNMYDSVLIVRPDGKPWEKNGKSVLLLDGIASYPFTGGSIYERMTSLTIDSLFDSDPLLMAHLRDKNVLVYFDCVNVEKRMFLEYVRSAYYNAAAGSTVPDFEVVIVPVIRGGTGDVSYLSSTEMWKWHIVPPVLADKAAEKVYTLTELKESRSNTIVAFGKNGCICTRSAQNYLRKSVKDIGPLFVKKMSKKEADSLRLKVEDHLKRICSDIENEGGFYGFW